MIRKISIVLIIISFILSNCFFTKVYAEETPVCTLEADFNKDSAKPGEEIELSISTTQVNEAIAGVGFSLNYDESVLEFVELNNAQGWTTSKTENLFTIFTTNYEAVTQTGKIGGIILKVKNNIEATDTNITLTAVQVTKDDASSIDLNEITKTLTIDYSTSEEENNQDDPNENGNNQDDPNENGNNQDDPNEDGNNQDDPNEDGNNQDDPNEDGNNQDDPNEDGNIQDDPNEDGNNQEDSNEYENNQEDSIENGNTNNEESSNQNTKENTSKKDSALPYTGSFAATWGIIVMITIIGVISFIKYRKYRKI